MTGPGWAHRPEVLVEGDPRDQRRLDELRRDPCTEVVDQLVGQRAELARLRPGPGGELLDEAPRWVHYPWRRCLVRTLGPASFRRLRLDRNRNKVTLDEQARFERLRIGVIGLSVGHVVAHTLALEGLAGQLRLADFDEIELSNLNRVPASLLDLGRNKAVVAARRIAELDPYLDVVVETAGITEATLGPFLDDLDLVIEECDSLDVKLLVREGARDRRIPVLMETSDRGLLDVERFDLEPRRPLFHGLVDDLDSGALRDLGTRDKAPVVLRILEPAELSPRLAASMAEIDRTVTTWPQLGGDVVLGAATLAAAVRRLGRGDDLPSGRVRLDLDDHLAGLAAPAAAACTGGADAHARPDTAGCGSDHGTAGPLAAPSADQAVLRALAAAAGLAPSGGNVQPWAFEADGAELRFLLRPERSSSMDVRYRGSLVALGAAMLNARVAAAAAGRLGPVELAGVLDVERPVGVLRLGHGGDASLAALAPALPTRATNRHPSRPGPLEPALLDDLAAAARHEGGTVHWVTGGDRLAAVGEVLAEADRLRFLSAALHREMVGELRWPGDPLQTGIDVRTLELDAADRAKLDVVRRADVVAHLAEWDAGSALGDATRHLVSTSAALAVVTVPGTSAGHYLRGGATVERLWLAAELAGVALHPVSPLFLFALDDDDVAGLVAKAHHDDVVELAARFRQHVGVGDGDQLALVLRAGRAPRPTIRSRREPLCQVLRGPAGAGADGTRCDR